MLQTRRQAVRLLQRPRFHQLRGYADDKNPAGIDPNAGNDPSDVCHQSYDENSLITLPQPHDSIGKPSGHAASAGHVEPTQRSEHPAPENEYMGVGFPPLLIYHRVFQVNLLISNPYLQKGFYITLAVLFGSLAFYKFNRTDFASGEASTQPFITRLLHYFDYLGEQNTLRNDLFTNMIQQAGHDRNLFDTATRTSLGQIAAAEYVFQHFFGPLPSTEGALLTRGCSSTALSSTRALHGMFQPDIQRI